MPTKEEVAAAEIAKAKEEKEAAEIAAEKAVEEKAAKEAKELEKQRSFESWLEGQPKDIQDKYNENTRGLKTALKTERTANKEAVKAQKKLIEFEKAEKKRKEAEMTEIEKIQLAADSANDELKIAKSELEQMKLNETKREIANEVGLPVQFALRILGETPEEMTEDAKVLMGAMPKAGTRISPTAPGRIANKLTETDAERRKRLLS